LWTPQRWRSCHADPPFPPPSPSPPSPSPPSLQVCHFASKTYRHIDYFNDVDKDSVPVPHFGVVLTVDEFRALADRVRKAGVAFIVEPHIRFEGKPGEQWTMFFKDPSGNNLEFKAMANPANLFAKYFVDAEPKK
jgi:extradiol dioxygenase family protein